METIEIPYKPGDRLRYYSKRFGWAEMTVLQVNFRWFVYGGKTLKFGGISEYESRPQTGRYRRTKGVWISDLKKVTLVTT
jgi:hypothetical protein